MAVEFNIRDLRSLQKRIAATGKTMDEVMRTTATDLANRVMREAKKNTPVDTGALRNSFRVEDAKTVDGLTTARIYTDPKVHYAEYVEYGHRTRAALPGALTGKKRVSGKKNRTTVWVQGFYMLTLAEKKIQLRARDIVSRSIKKQIEERLKG